jgi:ABC-type sugar transport system ATPase subunit
MQVTPLVLPTYGQLFCKVSFNHAKTITHDIWEFNTQISHHPPNNWPSINLLPHGILGINGGPNKATTMGIRPENIIIGKKGFSTRIQGVEHLGTETVIKLKIDGHEIVALAPPGRTFKNDEKVSIAVQPDTTLYFDENGNRIT